MKKTETNLLATCKTVDTFGDANATDFPALSIGGQQFALIKTAVTATAGLGTDQVTGDEEKHGGALDEAAVRLKLHTDLLNISTAVHSLVLLGTTGLAGQFHMPRHDGDQELLNVARAFAADAAPIQAQLIGLKLPATFLADLNQDIADFEKAFKAKGSGKGKKARPPPALPKSSTTPASPCTC